MKAISIVTIPLYTHIHTDNRENSLLYSCGDDQFVFPPNKKGGNKKKKIGYEKTSVSVLSFSCFILQ